MLHRTLVISLYVLTFVAAPALTEERFALVIGNGAYAGIDPLPNPPNDGRIVSQALEAVGFKVTTLIDADFETMDVATNEFATDLDNAGENTVGIFYYAGHGVTYRGENWLIPIGSEIKQATHLKYRTISANYVLELMEAARNATDIMILDACRNSPYRGFSLSGTRAVAAGMSRMQIAPTGSFIAYSTAPGKVAYDGSGDYSAFAEAFAHEVVRSNESIGDMMIDVRVSVKEATDRDGLEPQIPWTSSSLMGKFWFNPREGTVEPPSNIFADAARIRKSEEPKTGEGTVEPPSNILADAARIRKSEEPKTGEGTLEPPSNIFADYAARIRKSEEPKTVVVESRKHPLPAEPSDRVSRDGRDDLIGIWELQSNSLLGWYREYRADGTYKFTNPRTVSTGTYEASSGRFTRRSDVSTDLDFDGEFEVINGDTLILTGEKGRTGILTGGKKTRTVWNRQ